MIFFKAVKRESGAVMAGGGGGSRWLLLNTVNVSVYTTRLHSLEEKLTRKKQRWCA